MTHLKRHKAPKSWPIERKEKTFVVNPRGNLETGIPILVLLRDLLKIAKNRREVKKSLKDKKILLNLKPIKDEKQEAKLFDILTIVPGEINYKISLGENGRFSVEETQENKTKIAKIIGKKMLKGKQIQLNLSDGRNFLDDKKCKTNDSVVIDLEKKKIIECLELKEGSNAIAFAGKHSGKKGKIKKIIPEKKIVELDSNKEKFNILIKHIMVTK